MATKADLLEHLELPQCECLNASKEHTLRHCIEAATRDDPETYLQSDCDEVSPMRCYDGQQSPTLALIDGPRPRRSSSSTSRS